MLTITHGELSEGTALGATGWVSVNQEHIDDRGRSEARSGSRESHSFPRRFLRRPAVNYQDRWVETEMNPGNQTITAQDPRQPTLRDALVLIN